VAQTKRKRRSSKHRGNAAGVVETRGRTGRPPTDEERKGQGKKPANRLDSPPTWKGSANRAAIAAALFGVMIVLLFKQDIKYALPMTAAVLVFYIPLGYYTDLAIFRWRERKKLAAKP
jgi:hypothetical protein